MCLKDFQVEDKIGDGYSEVFGVDSNGTSRCSSIRHRAAQGFAIFTGSDCLQIVNSKGHTWIGKDQRLIRS